MCNLFISNFTSEFDVLYSKEELSSGSILILGQGIIVDWVSSLIFGP
jgi:hypothetical protein